MIVLLAALACVDINTLQRDFGEAQRIFDEASALNAVECTPYEYAMAESHLAFTLIEFEQGDPQRAREHVDVATQNARIALETAPECLPKDLDGDEITDDMDACPEEPEDFDGYEDDDGCPDLDHDGDGIAEDVDQCPVEPEDVDGYMDTDGCPDTDNDSDAILDVSDDCPDEAEDIDGFEDTDGCPDRDNDGDGFADVDDVCPDVAGPQDGCPLSDSDGDGFLDEEDRCPTESGVAPDGCPVKDFDQDGILDAEDMCPGEAGPPVTNGCPDRDGDGIIDRDDRCPVDRENINEYMDEDGCPDTKPQKVKISNRQIVIEEQIQFETGRAVIKPASYGILNDVIQVMEDYPQIEVRIEGHTDSVGDDSSNLRLSKARADAVFEYLIENGIEASRLETQGYGETRPIDTNKTAEGKQNNRRVEFHITKGLD